MARFLPFHRIFHSVEMSLLALVSTIVTAIAVPIGAAPLFGERWLITILVPLCFLSVVGHFLSIMRQAAVMSDTSRILSQRMETSRKYSFGVVVLSQGKRLDDLNAGSSRC
ncbi:hypothetical protein [Brevibacterium aurantiacum]|uniref:hypothetical protein n=1 Tax=Brevibacterium aurantiacum TaxID=273384 RepID=UPI001F49C094|nr:hypothetical protein [Brevibacterium aurantiacum]